MTDLLYRRALREQADQSVLILVKDRHATQKFAGALQRIFGQAIAVQLINEPQDFINSPERTVLISSPALVQTALSSRSTIASFSNVIAFDFHLLDADYELVLTHFRHTTDARLVLLSFPLFDASSAARWIGCPDEHTYGFGPNARSKPLQTDIRPVSTARAGAFLQTALKPAHEMLKEEGQPAICVVPTASACRTSASTFVRQLATDLNPDSFVGDAAMLEEASGILKEDQLCDIMMHGISVCHEAMPTQVRRLMLRLFVSGATRLMVTTPGVCLGHSMTAPMLVVVGIQTPLLADDGARTLADYDPARLYQLQNVPSGSRPKCVFLCEPHQEDSSLTPLKNGLLLESELMNSPTLLRRILEHVREDRNYGSAALMPLLSSTFVSQRIAANPGYYGYIGTDHASNLSRAADGFFNKLRTMCCLRSIDSVWQVSAMGHAALNGTVDLDALLQLRALPLALSLARFQESTSGKQKEEASQEDMKPYVRVQVEFRIVHELMPIV